MAERKYIQERRGGRPVFFWQGTLIVLPVTALAVVSLFSLRQDERNAELDARNRAAENVQSLAKAVRLTANDELHRYIWLQNDWLAGLGSSGNAGAGTNFPGAKLSADVARWEADYPGLKIADSAAMACEVLPDGRQVWPPDSPGVPTPPKWFVELSPQQKDAWAALRAATNFAQAATLVGEFAGSTPSADARLAAAYATNSPEELLGKGRDLATEAGISFQDVACFKLLTAANARLSDWLVKSIWNQVVAHPSFVAPKLIGLAEGLTNRAEAVARQRLAWLQLEMDKEDQAGRWVESLRRLPEMSDWKPPGWAHWTEGGEALAVVMPMASVNPRTTTEGNVLSGRGYLVSFLPRKVVEAVFAKALGLNEFLVPDYVTAAISVEGQHQGLAALDPPERALWADAGHEVLGRAEETAGNDSATQDAIHFDVRFVLTSKERMLSTARRRARLFTGLILGAVFAAVAGLVTARRAFYRQLRLNEMKSNFVSSVSHELRAPIASVRLMAENLDGGKVAETPRQREYFRFIVQECRRLSSLIENVLDFSRIEQGRKEYEFEPTDLVALAQSTVKLMEPGAAEKGVRLDASNISPETAPREWNVDGRAIQQALVNLIDNAIKHSPTGETVTVGVEVRNGPAPAVFRLAVADHGPGIPASEHERIFERFYRLGSELRRTTQGVGIGLSVVQHIVTAHGGRVAVESEPGRGSRFTIELPARNQNE